MPKSKLEIPTSHRTDITLSLARGLELLRKHLWSHAVVALSAALELDPHEPKALEYRARCFMMLGQMNSALEDAERLVQVDNQRNAHHAEKVVIMREKQEQMLLQQQLKREQKLLLKGKQQQQQRSPSPGGLSSSDGEENGNEQQRLSPSVKFATAAKSLVIATRFMRGRLPTSMTTNVLLEQQDGEQQVEGTSSSSSLSKKTIIMKKALSPTERSELSQRLLAPTGSSVQRNRMFYSRAQVIGSSDDYEIGDDHDDDDDDEIDGEHLLLFDDNRRRKDENVNHSPFSANRRKALQAQFQNSNTNNKMKHLNNEHYSPASNAGSPKGFAAETATRFSQRGLGRRTSSRRNNNSNNRNTQATTTNQQQNKLEVQTQIDMETENKIHTKYYQGILLRAQVLFAMGCFEDACRQFHAGSKLRHDVDEFRTGITECEHILIGAVHPWRKRIPKPTSEEIATLRSNMATPSGGVASSPSKTKTGSLHHHHHHQPAPPTTTTTESHSRKRWVAPRTHLNSRDKDLLHSMPENSKDFFFLRQLRQHPRIFSTGLGPGITRGINDPGSRDSSSGGGGAFEGGTTKLLFGSGFGTVGGRGSSRAGVGGRFANANDSNDYFLQSAETSTGPALLAAFCAASAIETAEEEALAKQNATLLAMAESAAERQHRQQHGQPTDGEKKKDGNNNHNNNNNTETKSHGMFGSGSILDDDDANAKKRRNFHIRPPDTRSWGVQSARGRRSMKDAVDTTLKYLETQQHFWAHRDERTAIPMEQEPDLPPRFRPGKKFDNYLKQQQQQNQQSQRKNSSSPLNHRPQSASTRNRIPLRPVTTANAEQERVEIIEKDKRKRRASMIAVSNLTRSIQEDEQHRRSESPNDEMNSHPSLNLLSFSSNPDEANENNKPFSSEQQKTSKKKKKDQQKQATTKAIPRVITKNSSRQEEAFMSDMHEVFKLMADQHKMQSDNPEGSEIQFHRNQRNYQKFQANSSSTGGDQHISSAARSFLDGSELLRGQRRNSPDANRQFPNITSHEFTFIPQSHRDEVSSHVLAIPSRDAGPHAPAPIFVSANLRAIHHDIQLALSRGQAQVFMTAAQQMTAANGEDFSSSVGDGNNKSEKSGKGAGKKSTSSDSSFLLNHPGGDDLARITRALFESGDEPYHNYQHRMLLLQQRQQQQQQNASKNNNATNLPMSSPPTTSMSSPQRAVTLRWGEYDGVHLIPESELEQTTTATNLFVGGKNPSSNKKSPQQTAIEQKHQSRQFARHQRARALLAQNIQKELGVELPYEAIFRVPERPRTSQQQQQQNQNQSGRPRGGSGKAGEGGDYFIPFEAMGIGGGEKEDNIENFGRNSPSQISNAGRDYATVSVKASPPQRPWSMRPDAVLTDTRQQEIEKAEAIQREKEQTEKEDRTRRKRERRERRKIRHDHGIPLEEEQEEIIDKKTGEKKVVMKRKKLSPQIIRRYSPSLQKKKMIINVWGEEEEVYESPNEDDDDNNETNSQNNNVVVDEIGEYEEENEDLSSTDGEDRRAELEEEKPKLTLDQVRSQYSRSAKQRLRRMSQSSNQSGGLLLDANSTAGLGAGLRSRMGRSFLNRATSFQSSTSNQIPSDNETESDSSDDDEGDDVDEDEIEGVQTDDLLGREASSGSFRGDDDGFKKDPSSTTSAYQNVLDNENATVAEAVSAAKALLLEQQKRGEMMMMMMMPLKQQGSLDATGFGFRPQTPTQQQQQQQQKDATSSMKHSVSASSYVITSNTPSRHESTAMKRLNATLRNIARLCSLGDVPLAISIAAALVKELEAADSSLSSSSSSSARQNSKSKSHQHHHQPTTTEMSASNSVSLAFTTLAARIRCTLGALYLEIGEGPAAIGELSRAVLLAKRSQQGEVYEQAVKLLGECYQSSGEEVDVQIENSGNQPRRRRATSVVRV